MSTDTINEVIKFVKDKAVEFGAITEGDRASYVFRNNTGAEALKDDGAFFGFIQPTEEPAGVYHDFSLVLFPSSKEGLPWLICLGIGTGGFKHDYELARIPWPRRLFGKLVDSKGYVKSDFTDLESRWRLNFRQRPEISHLKRTIERYNKVLPVAKIIDDPLSEEGRQIIERFVAAYAQLREWPRNESHKKAVKKALQDVDFAEKNLKTDELIALLGRRKFLVLQGAPGTGKTYLANRIAENMRAKTFLTQFHAETSYSDFVYGLYPTTVAGQLVYEGIEGDLTKAIRYAQENPKDKVLFIIDEINRANLSSVLGPVFYLFEYQSGSRTIEINLSPTLSISKLPDNFYVVATMNTADRSIAIVDFALRRRFAWVNLVPERINSNDFYNGYFSEIGQIFYKYADDFELNLQPGQGYFLADGEEEMKDRIRYEIFPLIKEYMDEGLLLAAKEEFNHFFQETIEISLYR
jgi:hypothetical protein